MNQYIAALERIKRRHEIVIAEMVKRDNTPETLRDYRAEHEALCAVIGSYNEMKVAS